MNNRRSGESSTNDSPAAIAEAWNWVITSRENARRARANGKIEMADFLNDYANVAATVLLKHGYLPPGD